MIKFYYDKVEKEILVRKNNKVYNYPMKERIDGIIKHNLAKEDYEYINEWDRIDDENLKYVISDEIETSKFYKRLEKKYIKEYTVRMILDLIKRNLAREKNKRLQK